MAVFKYGDRTLLQTPSLRQMASMVFPRNNRAGAWEPTSQSSAALERKAKLSDAGMSSIIMSCVNWIARSFVETPIVVMEQANSGGKPIISRRHPLARLLDIPNPGYDGGLMIKTTVASLVLTGETFLLPIYSRSGQILELWYAPSNTMDVKSTPAKFVDYYEYTPGAQKIQLAPDEVIHLRMGLNEKNLARGESPLWPVLREVLTDDEASKFTTTLLNNMGMIGILVTPEDEGIVSEEDAQKTRDYLEDRFTGRGRGRPAVMRTRVRVQNLSQDPQHLSLTALRRIPEERITGILGVPAAVAGMGAGLDSTKVGATLKELERQAWRNGVIPIQTLIAKQLTNQLLPAFESNQERFWVTFDRSRVPELQEDRKVQTEVLDRRLRSGGITRAEYREELEYEVNPEDDVFIMPANMILVARDAAPVEPDETPEPDGSNPPEGDVPADDGDTQPGNTPPPSTPVTSAEDPNLRQEPTAEQSRLIRRFLQSAEELSDGMSAGLVTQFDDLSDVIRAAYNPANQDIEIANAIAEAVGIWSQASLSPQYEATWVSVLQQTIDDVETVMGIGVDIPDPIARNIVRQGGTRIGLLDLTAKAHQQVFEILAYGIENGLDIGQIEKLMAERIPAGRFRTARIRARIIARTEIKYAQNVSAVSSYQRSSANITHAIAFDAQLRQTDAECEARNGGIFTLEEAHRLSGEEHPNGTLSWAPVVPR